MTPRFTIDGSNALEQRLARLCEEVWEQVRVVVPPARLQTLVLGGGYGRGQGGVLRSVDGDCPYNDLEFYVFLRGNELLNNRTYRAALTDLAERLSPAAGLHLEFKIVSSQKLRRSPISMFSYDLVAGHRIIAGAQSVFYGCAHHLAAEKIPLSEATRLLFNRCSGLLLAREFLRAGALSSEQADFVGRNLAKAQLALGDAVLTACEQYHWSCLERHRRLQQLAPVKPVPSIEIIAAHHAVGVEFKLHPTRQMKPAAQFEEERREISSLAQQLWLRLESCRLKGSFASARDYALSNIKKCPETRPWRNLLLNVNTFGQKALLDFMACRYPRERLFNALPLLLWEEQTAPPMELARHLQKQLHTSASDWPGWVAAYKRVWPSYG